jgi:hypothetical protein
MTMPIETLQKLIEEFRIQHGLAGIVVVTFERVPGAKEAEYSTVMHGAYDFTTQDVRVLNQGAPQVLRQLANGIEQSVKPPEEKQESLS